MHELSIIQSIVEIAEEQVQARSASQVEEIELEIGELAGVEWGALDFAWDVGVQQSVLQDAKRIINKIRGVAKCAECNTEFHMQKLYDKCPECQSYFNTIVKGKELRVKALTIS
jgi:hydrogenase nickel incorporation protein HypA/HybF